MKKFLVVGLLLIVSIASKAQYPLSIAGYDNAADSLIIPIGSVLPAAVIDGKGNVTKDVLATVALVLKSNNYNDLRDVGLLVQNGDSAVNEKIGIVILGQYDIPNEVTGNLVDLTNTGSGTVKGYTAQVTGDTAVGIKTFIKGISANSHIIGGELSAIADTSLKSNTQAYGSVGVAMAGTPIGLLGSASGVSDTITNSTAIGVYGFAQNSKVNYGVLGVGNGGSPNVNGSLSVGLLGMASGSAVNYAAYLDGNVFINGNLYTSTSATSSSKTRKVSSVQNTLAKINALNVIGNMENQGLHYSFTEDEFVKTFPELVKEIPLANHQEQKIKMTGETQTAINYSEMIPLLTKALQEQQEMIRELQESNKALAQKVNFLGKNGLSGK